MTLYFTIFTLLPLLCSFLTHHAGLVLCQTWSHTACVCADHLHESVPSTQKINTEIVSSVNNNSQHQFLSIFNHNKRNITNFLGNYFLCWL